MNQERVPKLAEMVELGTDLEFWHSLAVGRKAKVLPKSDESGDLRHGYKILTLALELIGRVGFNLRQMVLLWMRFDKEDLIWQVRDYMRPLRRGGCILVFLDGEMRASLVLSMP